MIEHTNVAPPLWVIAYFSIYATYCLWANFEDLKSKHWVLVGFELSFNVALIVPAAMFWHLGDELVPRGVGLFLYITGCASVIFQVVRGLKNFPDSSLSFKENIGLSLTGLVLVCAMVGPAVWWGGVWLLASSKY